MPSVLRWVTSTYYFYYLEAWPSRDEIAAVQKRYEDACETSGRPPYTAFNGITPRVKPWGWTIEPSRALAYKSAKLLTARTHLWFAELPPAFSVRGFIDWPPFETVRTLRVVDQAQEMLAYATEAVGQHGSRR